MGQICSFCAPGSIEELKPSPFDISIDNHAANNNNSTATNNNLSSNLQSTTLGSELENTDLAAENERLHLENERKKQKEQERLDKIVLSASTDMVTVNNNNQTAGYYFDPEQHAITNSSSSFNAAISNIILSPLQMHDRLPKTNVEVNAVMDILSSDLLPNNLQKELSSSEDEEVNIEKFSTEACINEIMNKSFSYYTKNNLFHGLDSIVEILP